MSKKVKFNPMITRVKLNPEQAVLSCTCFNGYWKEDPGAPTGGWRFVCSPGASKTKQKRFNYSLTDASS